VTLHVSSPQGSTLTPLTTYGSGTCSPVSADHYGQCSCPEGWQDEIDELYSNCDGFVFDDIAAPDDNTWETAKPSIKAGVEACGCGGAPAAGPGLLLAAASVLLLRAY
jgi:hypothetical protein